MPLIIDKNKDDSGAHDALQTIRDKTKAEVLDLLDRYKMACVIRCTGFGKTWLLSEMTTLYDKVLYIYPAKCIMNTAVNRIQSMMQVDEQTQEELEKEELAMLLGKEKEFKNVKFMTYSKLARLTRDAIKVLPDYDLIILDECHKCGGALTRIAVENLMKFKKDSNFLGATATPDRSDAFDVIGHFFTVREINNEGEISEINAVVSEYTLHDAFQDGIIKPPHYCYMTTDHETNLKQEALTAGEDINDMHVKEVLKKGLIEIANLFNVPNIMKEVVGTYVKDPSYMKYIVFFSSFKQLDDKLPDVIGWFNDAFPTHEVETITVTSRTKEQADNVDIIEDMPHINNRIDLIACVDMLNLGYHVSDLTGILMYRCTSSTTIYIQQLGRALSTGSGESAIVFDIVDNIHRKSIFDLSVQGLRRPRNAVEKEEVLVDIDVTDLSQNEINKLRKEYKKNLVDVTEDDNGNVIMTVKQSKQWWHFVNAIAPEDIYMTGHEATYRELIAKVVAEPEAERIKRVQEEHYRLWCKINKVPYPLTLKEMKKNLNKVPPLPLISRWQNVSVEHVLNNMFPNGKDIDPMKYGPMGSGKIDMTTV